VATPEVTTRAHDDLALAELRLFLEKVCCDVIRLRHAAEDGIDPGAVAFRHELFLGATDTFADIRVARPGHAPYFVEVKNGYSADHIVSRLARKYGRSVPEIAAAEKLILVADVDGDLANRVRGVIHPSLELELWDESALLALIRKYFGVDADGISPESIAWDLRLALNRAEEVYAFGAGHAGEPHQNALIWQIGFWRLAQLSAATGLSSRDILAPGLYRDVCVVSADLSSFSSYVRDTHDDRVVRQALTSFYAKCRCQVLNAGGMFYQYLGDGVLALFGIPQSDGDGAVTALRCAAALLDIGESVMNKWQRHIDNVQDSAGCHIGLALGDLNVISASPFSRTYMGAFGEAINLAARLTAEARVGEIVVSNALYQRLPDALQDRLECLDSIEVKNMGRVRAWKVGAEDARAVEAL
jgi:class 3 adenylate cyclase